MTVRWSVQDFLLCDDQRGATCGTFFLSRRLRLFVPIDVPHRVLYSSSRSRFYHIILNVQECCSILRYQKGAQEDREL